MDEQVIVAGGEADAIRQAVIDECGYPLFVDKCCTAEALVPVGPFRAGRQRNRMVRPVNQIRTGGVAPMDRAMKSSIGIVLVKDVVSALPENGSVRIVHPVDRG